MIEKLLPKCMHAKNSNDAEIGKRSAIFREFFIFELQLALLTKKDGNQLGYGQKI